MLEQNIITMAKKGNEYQEIVAMVLKTLNPHASVKTGQWIEGPDGKREIDVEVRGIVDKTPHFILIECKDWKIPVDIQEIDKLNDKRRDLQADAVIISSNSGFTKKALRKAERVGIDAISAIVLGNKIIRIVIERELVAKKLSVDRWQVTLYPNSESNKIFPDKWDIKTLRFNNLPVVNWLSKLSHDLILKYEGESKIIETVAFKQETLFKLEDLSITLRGLRIEMNCSRQWLSQTVREDVSLGYYNHITRRLTVPNNQLWFLGWIDNNAWKEIKADNIPEEWTTELEPNSFICNITLLNPIENFKNEGIPPIDNLISERRTDLL